MAAPRTMRALQYDRYGGGAEGLKHVEVPIPSPKKGEVLLKLEAASINPVDWKIQKGMARPFLPRKFPFVPVGDLSGEVVELGSGVSNFKPGDKVISISFPNGGGLAGVRGGAGFAYGGKATRGVYCRRRLPADCRGHCAPATEDGRVSFDGSGGTGPKIVLVTAASGGVGHYAVQLAKLAGLLVTATCGARNVGFVKGLGADEVLDYKTPEGAALQSPTGRKYDAVVHCATGTPWSVFKPTLADKSTVVDVTRGIGAAVTSFLQKVTFSKKRLVPFVLMPRRHEMEWLVDMARQGKLKTVVDSKYALNRAEEAWAKSIEGHAAGKIVVEIRGAE